MTCDSASASESNTSTAPAVPSERTAGAVSTKVPSVNNAAGHLVWNQP